jgi:hypothetical protein
VTEYHKERRLQMSANSATMSMSDHSSYRQAKFVPRFILYLLFVATMIFWLIMFMRSSFHLSRTLWMVIANIWLALSAGLGARLAFYNRNWLIRFAAATISFILSLVALGYLTNWKMGINPIAIWTNKLNWLDFIRLNWIEVAQLLGGIVVIFMSLRIWWRGSHVLTSSPGRSRSANSYTSSPRRSLPTENVISQPRRGAGLKIAQHERASTFVSSVSDKLFFRHSSKSVLPRRKRLFQRKPNLQISVYEEHRCPYCLEDVKRNDPRGVKECDVCHTLHHADCWNITGMCQVPHQNPLNT